MIDADRLAQIQAIIEPYVAAVEERRGLYPDSVFTAAVDLLAMVRERDAALGRVGALADAWESRGEHDMRFSKTIPDEDIAIAILTDGAQKVENARLIRAAVSATEGAE